MPILYRQRFRFGPWYRANASRSGISHTVVFWPLPLSWNSRTRRLRLDLPGPFSWQSRRRMSFGGALFRLALFPLALAAAGWVVLQVRDPSGLPGWLRYLRAVTGGA